MEVVYYVQYCFPGGPQGEDDLSPGAVKQLLVLEAVEARLGRALASLEEAVEEAGPELDSRARDHLMVRRTTVHPGSSNTSMA